MKIEFSKDDLEFIEYCITVIFDKGLVADRKLAKELRNRIDNMLLINK
jgi:hypothetical protein